MGFLLDWTFLWVSTALQYSSTPLLLCASGCVLGFWKVSWLSSKWGRTGFDWRSDNRTACRGRLVGLVKNRVKKNKRQPRTGSRGLIDRDVPDRTPAKVGSDDSRLVRRWGDRAGGRDLFRGHKGESYAPVHLAHLIKIG